MNRPIERMKELMPSLPERDIPLGYKFLEDKDFESLTDLVDSAIYKVRKNLKSETPREEYIKVNLDELNKLKSEVDMYCAQLVVPDNSYDVLDEYELEDNFY